jgi:hypothetical protein
MYKLRPYEATDLFRANWRDRDKGELLAMGRENAIALSEYYADGPCWTLLWNDSIILCAGVITIWQGLGEAWFRGTPLMYDHREKVKAETISVFQTIKKHGGFRRIQTAVQEDWATARRFAEACGMKNEGRMPFYGMKGEHFVRYAITDEE